MLTLENLTFDVNDDEGGKGIIKDLNLTIGDGKFVVITGCLLYTSDAADE